MVKDDGNVLCYHFYDRNLFEDYLYYNTRLESPSSSKYEFATLYRGQDGNLYFKLNLQIGLNDHGPIRCRIFLHSYEKGMNKYLSTSVL